MDRGCCRREGVTVMEEGERERSTQGDIQGECFSEAIGLKNKKD